MKAKTTSFMSFRATILLFFFFLACSPPLPCRSHEHMCLLPLRGQGTSTYRYICNEEDVGNDQITRDAIDAVLDGLLSVPSVDFNYDGGDVYCDKSNGDLIYGYIYCASGDKAACQDKLQGAYADVVEKKCGRYRVGAQVVASDGSCLRYEKYWFCPWP
ncbi:unnamed protein product [Linum trigynum]|uniref:Gnk2-homologous domain-containing protein n=1 Tax=Linum trigynum TaxID=586398 RepID=A0AAV2D6W5_9ROSI